MSKYNIAIYGDSFGAGFAHNISEESKKKLSHIGKSWVELLSEQYQITNYCEFSSSLIFSVDKFIDTHHLYDKVIFLVTCPGRVTMSFPNKNQPLPHFISYESAKLWEDRAKKENWLTELHSVLNYYLYVFSPKFEKTIHQSLVEKVRSIRNDVILVPNFVDSFENIVGNVLVDIFDMENREWNVSYPIFDYDMRKCHMCRENNEILAKKVNSWLNGDPVLLNIDDFVKPTLGKDYYIFDRLP